MELGPKYLFIVLIAVISLFVLFASKSDITYAVDDNVTVDVSVTALTEITVTPSIINWSLITPGQVGGNVSVDILNTGSVNVTNIYSFMSTIYNETERPYGSSFAGDYSAGAVVVLRNESNTQYFWAGRLEWNWTEAIANTNRTDLNAPTAEGFLRNASVSFYWNIGNGTGGLCNNTGSQFAIEDDPDNGTVMSRTPTVSDITRNGGDTNFSYFSVTRSTNFLNGFCVAVGWECDKIYVYNFDRRTGIFNGSTCTASDWITAGPLAPYDVEKVVADVWIPKGIPEGTLERAVWTFVAS